MTSTQRHQDASSSGWSAIRITPSSSIKAVVTRALLHLSDPSSGPLVLHTLPPSPSPQTKYTSTNAGLCKLVSIAEITKREFQEFQRSWRAEGYREEQQRRRQSEQKKRKKENNENEEEEEEVEKLNPLEGDDDVNRNKTSKEARNFQKTTSTTTTTTTTTTTKKRTHDGMVAGDEDGEGDDCDEPEQPGPDVGVGPAVVHPRVPRKRAPPLLQLFQYNELNCFERLPGYERMIQVSSKTAAAGAGARAGAAAAREAEDGEDEGDEDTSGDGQTSLPEIHHAGNLQAGLEHPLLPTTTTAADGGSPAQDVGNPEALVRLDAAILDHVIRGKRRPRKKHTPYMKITLYSARLPDLERELKGKKQDYTIQVPDRPKRSRKRKSRRKLDGAAPSAEGVPQPQAQQQEQMDVQQQQHQKGDNPIEIQQAPMHTELAGEVSDAHRQDAAAQGADTSMAVDVPIPSDRANP